MSAAVRAFPSLLRIGFASVVAYRAELVVWILTASLPLVMLGIYDRIADAGPVAGLDHAGVAGYFVSVLIVRQLASTWLVWELNHQIRTGSLSSALLRPVHPMVWFAAESLATLPLRAVVLAPLLGLIVLWRPELQLALNPLSLLLFALSVAMAWLLNFAVHATFASLAFWLGQSMGLFGVWFAVFAVFSGYMMPIEAMPPLARTVAEWAPFRGLIAVPADLLSGRIAPAHALPHLLAQAVWLLVFAGLGAALWARGVRRYEGQGA